MAFFGLFDKPASTQTNQSTEQQTQQQSQQQQQQPQPTPQPTPLEPFADLWKAPVVDPNKPADLTTPGKIFSGANLDEMRKAAQGINFVQGVDPKLVETIGKGGPEAAQALMNLINTVGQDAYARAAFVSTQITDRGLTAYDTGLNSRLPDTIKRFTVRENNASQNPAWNDPAVSPLIVAVEQQMQAKYPHASASEISDKAKEYLAAVAGTITRAKPQSQSQSQSSDPDWEKFFKPS